MDGSKVCKTCVVLKPIDDFYNCLNECKKCHNLKYKEYKKLWEKNKRTQDKVNRERVKLIKKQEREKELELIKIEKETIKLEKIRILEDNRLKRICIRDEFLKSDEYKEQLRLRKEKERLKSKEKWNRRMSSDPLYRFRKLLSNNVRKCFRNGGFNKSSRTQKILGDDWEVIKEYFESKFEVGMNWDNYGLWQIDHILPISTATCESDVIRLNHYTNLQPLWSKDNLMKSNNITIEGYLKQVFPYDVITKDN